MIDDITIATKLDDLGEWPMEAMSPLGSLPGRPTIWGSSRANGALFITYCPTTSVATVRISVPRWAGYQRYNYPLVPIQSVDGLRPQEIAVQAIAALGVTIPSDADPEYYFPIRTAAVTRVAYAADLIVSDPIAVIGGCMGLPRRNQASFTCWGTPIATVQWASKSLGVKLYSKGLELSTHRAKCDEERALLNELVASASKTVRFEVSFRRVRALRDFIGIRNDRIPNLALMCDPRIDRYALGREAHRLRLYESYTATESGCYASTVRHVAAVLQSAQARLANGDLGQVGRRKTLTEDRIWDLGAAFFWLSGFGAADLASWSGRSKATLAELRAELRELGIPPNESPTGGLGPSANELAGQLLPFIDLEHPDISDWRVSNGTACAPWASEVIEVDAATEPDNEDRDCTDGLTLSGEPDPSIDFDSLLASV